MVAKVISGGVHGIEGYRVNVETDISDGLPGFELTGNLGSEVREARERVRTALKNTGYHLPVKRITVNLSPSDRRKYGTAYDLPVAISVLCAMEEIPLEAISNTMFAGELMLSGSVRPVKGILPIVLNAKSLGITKCIIPAENGQEGALVNGVTVIGVRSLEEAVHYLKGDIEIEPEISMYDSNPDRAVYEFDMAQVNGQHLARRGMEIAAAGYHNMLFIGPPGAGKSMLAKCIPSIMPPLSVEESLQISSIYSVGGMLKSDRGVITKRPFVSPHHTATDISVIGGGSHPKPGAVSYAGKGVLFMDELPEFSRNTLEALRQPLEDKKVIISRNLDSIEYPADFMLVAAMNPCPCGMYPDLDRCTCTGTARQRYLNKLSKPLLDRIDICIQVEKVKTGDLLTSTKNESSLVVRKRVEKAHQIQRSRFKGTSICFNSQMTNNDIEKYVHLNEREKFTLKQLIDKYDLSARSYYRTLKVSRTIADLAGREEIIEDDLLEAIRLKCSSEILRGIN